MFENTPLLLRPCRLPTSNFHNKNKSKIKHVFFRLFGLPLCFFIFSIFLVFFHFPGFSFFLFLMSFSFLFSIFHSLSFSFFSSFLRYLSDISFFFSFWFHVSLWGKTALSLLLCSLSDWAFNTSISLRHKVRTGRRRASLCYGTHGVGGRAAPP